MKTSQVKNTAKTIAQATFETIGGDIVGPILDEAKRELVFGNFLGFKDAISSRPKEIGQEELKRAREEKELGERTEEDDYGSDQKAAELSLILQEYRNYDSQNGNSKEQRALKEEFVELREEVAKLAQASGVKTTAHMETPPQKIGLLDIKRLKSIIKDLTAKVEDSKNGKDMVAQRENAKRTTGMLAWVSGKQMKVHEQGTLTLQGQKTNLVIFIL